MSVPTRETDLEEVLGAAVTALERSNSVLVDINTHGAYVARALNDHVIDSARTLIDD